MVLIVFGSKALRCFSSHPSPQPSCSKRSGTAINVSLKRVCFYLIAVSFLGLFVTLGCWQAFRGIEKRQLLDEYDKRGELAMATVPATFTTKYQYQQVALPGRWDNQRVFFLDNRFYQHQSGYNIVQVFYPSASGVPVLVNRGFIGLPNGSRDVPPEFYTTPGEVTLSGRLYRPKPGIRLSTVDINPAGWPKKWPRLIQTLDVDAIATELGYPVAPYVVMLDAESSDAYPTEWQPTIMTPARHWGYAVQWWALALMVVVATVIFSRRK